MSSEHLTPEDLVALADSELRGAERAAAERHVSACAACARELHDFRRTGDLVAAMARKAGPADLAERVLARAHTETVAARASATANGRSGTLKRFPLLRLAAAAALLSAGVLGARYAFSPGSGSDGDVQLSASEEQAIARDLYLLHNLDALETTDSDELRALVEDLDLIESLMLEEQEG